MTLLKDNNYKDINIALLSLENDIKNKLANFDNSVINAQLEEINKRIDEINANANDNASINDSSAEINDIRTEIENINTEINTINSNIDNIEQQLSNVFLAENFVEDFNTTIEPGVYYWTDSSQNRPTNYGVLLVNRYKTTSNWINQIAYSTDGKICFRQKINDNGWRAWSTIAYEDITKTYTIPDVTAPTTRYIKLGTFPWHFAETVKVKLSGANLEDTVEFNVLGGNGNAASVNGWYTTNSGQTKDIRVVQTTPVTFASNVEVWLRVVQLTTLTVKLTGNSKAAQYFNSNPQMNNTTAVPSGSKIVATFNLKRGFFGYNENSLNCYETTMTGLGFTANQVVTLTDFAQAVINYTGTNRGRIHFTWSDASRAYIRATSPFNTQLEISGGTLTFNTQKVDVDAAQNTFDAEYVNRDGELFTFGISSDGNNINEYIRKEVDTSVTNSLRKNVDAGYLCKQYIINGSTNNAYNVILLGKIPDPASTAGPATPSASWDIDVDFYFVRSQGHKASWCNVKAGYGYSNNWRKYGSIETFGVDSGSSYTNPFYLVTLKYNNEWYIGVKHYINIDGNYSARVKNVHIDGGGNPSTVANTPLVNMLKAIGYLKTDGTVLNSEINSSMVELPSTYAPTIQRTGGLVLRNTTDVSVSSFGQEPLSIGTVTGDNLGIDGNEIQARYNGAAAALYINGNGGKVVINDTKASNGGLQVDGNTTLQGNSNVGLSSYGKDPLSIGPSSGANIGIDGDDIQARFNGNASSLDLNYYGGLVRINAQGLANGGLQVAGSLRVSGHLNIPTIAPTNPERGDIWLVL